MALPAEAAFSGFAADAGGLAGAAALQSNIAPEGRHQPQVQLGRPGPLSVQVVGATSRVPQDVLESFLASLGADTDTSVDDISFIPAEDVETAVSAFTVQGELASPLHRGQAKRFMNSIYKVCGFTAGPAAAGAAGAPGGGGGGGGGGDGSEVGESSVPQPASRKRKFSEVIDQADDRHFDELPASKITKLREEHVRITGGPPAFTARPSADQLSALVARLLSSPPFADFAIWGPFGRRTAKMLKFTTQVFVDGSLQTRMLRGPSSFESWRHCWLVFKAAMLMVGAARPSSLDAYEEGIRQLATLFPGGWGTLHHSDEVMRAEHWEILREDFVADPPSGWDPARPWDSVIALSAYGAAGPRSHWWETRVVLPLMTGGRRGSADDVVAQLEGSTTVRPVSATGVAISDAGAQPGSSRNARRKRSQLAQPSANHGPRVSAAPAGVAAKISKSQQYCYAWNRQGGCKEPCMTGRLHKCEHCDATDHPGKHCRVKGKGAGKSNAQRY